MTILDRPRTSLAKLLNAKPFRAFTTPVETPPKVVEKIEPPVDADNAEDDRSDVSSDVASLTFARDEAHHLLMCEELVTLWNRWMHTGGNSTMATEMTLDDALKLEPAVVRNSHETLMRWVNYSDHMGREHYCYCSPSRGQMLQSPYAYARGW